MKTAIVKKESSVIPQLTKLSLLFVLLVNIRSIFFVYCVNAVERANEKEEK